MAKTDVSPVPAASESEFGMRYPLLVNNGQTLAEMVADVLGGETLNLGDLDRVPMPTGKGLSFDLPDSEPTREIEGIIIGVKRPRTMWLKSITDREGDEDNAPPDCSSDDGEFGHGVYGVDSEDLDRHAENPTGQCETCPMNVWGSVGDNRRGKKCRELRTLFVMLPESILPVSMTLPPSSLEPFKKYILRTASRGLPLWSITTKITVHTEKSGANQWAVADFARGATMVPPEVIGQLQSFGKRFTDMTFRAIDVANDPVNRASES